MARHNDLGAWGEQLARDHLLGLGFTINDENAHAGGVEIDLVALRGTEVHFVEVKTRSTDFADPLDAVDKRKRARMVRKRRRVDALTAPAPHPLFRHNTDNRHPRGRPHPRIYPRRILPGDDVSQRRSRYGLSEYHRHALDGVDKAVCLCEGVVDGE